MACWLVKEEPASYSFADLQRDRTVVWTGVRNFQARNHLRAMSKGDQVIYYHTGKDKAAVGLATVSRAAFPDPSAAGGDWVSVELKAGRALPRPVPLAAVRGDALLKDSALVRQGRLSVVALTEAQFQRFLDLAEPA